MESDKLDRWQEFSEQSGVQCIDVTSKFATLSSDEPILATLMQALADRCYVLNLPPVMHDGRYVYTFQFMEFFG